MSGITASFATIHFDMMHMTDPALIFLANALFIQGLYAITTPGMLLGFVDRWFRRQLIIDSSIPHDGDIKVIRLDWRKDGLTWAEVVGFQRIIKTKYNAYIIENAPIWLLRYPLFDCTTCMSSVWGVAGFLLALYALQWPLHSLVWLPVYCVALAGLNAVIDGIGGGE